MITRLKYCMILLLLVTACTDLEQKKDSVSPDVKSRSTIKMNSKAFIDISTHDCEAMGGYQDKASSAIIIHTVDLKTFNMLDLYVYYTNVSDLSPGKKLPVENVNTSLLGFAASATDNATGQNWQTGIEGGNGTLTIKSFDRGTGLAAFDVVFTAMLVQSGQLIANKTATFSGTFENVPIFPDAEAFYNCTASTPGFTNNPGGNNNPGSGNPTNPGGNTGGSGTQIIFTNKTFLPVSINFNGETKTIPYGGNMTFTGKAGNTATGSASCANTTTSGEQIGSKISWELNYKFPVSGSLNVILNVPNSLFFLQLKNNSGKEITRLFVNYGLQDQSQDNILIPADGKQYRIGYYKAFSNSNVRAENTSLNWYWNWTTLSLPFTDNQSVTVTAN